MDNPLLAHDGPPDYATIRAEHIEPAIRAAIARHRQRLAAILAEPEPGFATLVEPFEEENHALARTWSPAEHLGAVRDSEAMRAACNACRVLLADYHAEVGQNAALHGACEAIREREGHWLPRAARRLLDNLLRDFRLAGVALPPEQRARFRELMQALATAQATFDENVLDATQAWSRHVTDPAELGGLPADALARAAAAARQRGLDGYVLTLDQPSYVAVLAHATNEPLRRQFYEAWTTRASDRGPHAGRYDNSALMERILGLRHETAQLLGFASYAELSLATKMAATPAEVLGFLGELARHYRPAAERELAELERFAGRRLAAWDVAFYAEKLREERHAVSQEALRPYFPLPRVLGGLAQVARQLYGLALEPRADVPLWHPDVRYYAILDHGGAEIAGFYLDPYARPGKRGGAWMGDCINRKHLGGRRAQPVAHLVCNFAPPSDGAPSLLTHSDVVTLFHEFGHGLHLMLTQVDYPSVAGINGVPWDAVELPSQFMEQYAWRAEVLPLISGHVETGEPLPAALLERLLASRNFHAGLAAVRQLEFALFDFRLHAEYDPATGGRIGEQLEAVRREVAVIRPPEFNRFAHAFTHVFSGGYAAGYYSYKWAEVLAADAFAAFEETGVFDAAIALRFLDAILSQGGSRDAMEAFVEFRGRHPEVGPLLRRDGIAA
ncbi:MAG: M3 family metallopeptidase [Steroidobacteraceae bacterium]|jgi:oligopeptidase A|nr:M3 family metallopeptidase [Steroidobacteraceae bacterium]